MVFDVLIVQFTLFGVREIAVEMTSGTTGGGGLRG